MIVGCSGAGKSTLSLQLHKLLGIQVFHLDQLYWKPGWVETNKEDFKKIHNNLVIKDEWIIDGNYSATMDDRLPLADTIIFLERSTITCLYRVFRRFLSGTRSDPIEGCKEQLEWEFIHYILIYNIKKRPKIMKRLIKINDHRSVHILKSNKDVSRFITEIKKSRNHKITGPNQ